MKNSRTPQPSISKSKKKCDLPKIRWRFFLDSSGRNLNFDMCLGTGFLMIRVPALAKGTDTLMVPAAKESSGYR